MAGRIQFDRDEALQAALLLFWRKGFNATSMEDLKTATGINESSLYNTFGNKKEIYWEALRAYGEIVRQRFAALPAQDHPAEAVRMALRHVAHQATQRDGAAGCMLMNSALELGAEHQDIVDFVRESYNEIENWLHQTIIHAQTRNEIPPNKDPRQLARFLTYSLQSMFTIARTNPTKEFMTDVVETTLSILK